MIRRVSSMPVGARGARGVGRLLAIGLGLLSLSACTTEVGDMFVLDGPMDVTVVDPDGLLNVPVGLVTNFRSGKIVKLDLKHETYVRDNPLGSWIRSAPLATGDERYLDQVAAYSRFTSDTDYALTVLASDATSDALLVVPWLDTGWTWRPGCLPFTPDIPRVMPCLLELESVLGAEQTLRDGTLPVLGPDGAALSGVMATGFWLREGKTTTETWTFVYREGSGSFQAVGSRSGVQAERVVPGETWYADGNELELRIDVTEGAVISDGAYLVLHTDTGIQELNLPGFVGDLHVLSDEALAVATLQADPDQSENGIGQGMLGLLDLSALGQEETEMLLDPLILCPVALDAFGLCPLEVRPMAMDLDTERRILYVADAGAGGVVYAVDFAVEPPEVRVLSGFGPNLDVAFVEDRTVEDGYRHLFVAQEDVGTIAVYDVKADVLFDINPVSPEVDPIRLSAPVRALAAGQAPVDIREATDDQLPQTSILVAATTFEKEVYAIRGESGCLTFGSPVKASVDSVSTDVLTLSADQGAASNPVIVPYYGNGVVSHAVLSECGGISKTETWSFVYDGIARNYKVRGTVSNAPGEYQERRAYENQRYVSDGGQVSVFIQSGTLPTTDGDAFLLSVIGNAQPYTAASYTGDIAVYTQTYGDRNEPWTAASFRAVAVLPLVSADRIMKLDLAWISNATNAELAEYR